VYARARAAFASADGFDYVIVATRDNNFTELRWREYSGSVGSFTAGSVVVLRRPVR
jgi:hypothetical protein